MQALFNSIVDKVVANVLPRLVPLVEKAAIKAARNFLLQVKAKELATDSRYKPLEDILDGCIDEILALFPKDEPAPAF